MQHVFRICSGSDLEPPTRRTVRTNGDVEDLMKLHILDEACVTDEQALRKVLDDFARKHGLETRS